MDIHRSSKTGPDLEDEAHSLAEDSLHGDVGIVKSTTTSEVMAYRCDRSARGIGEMRVESVDHNPTSAANVLFDHCWYGEVYGEDRRLIIGAEHRPSAVDILEEHLPEGVDVICATDEYRYIDDMSRRGGMIYHRSDFQQVRGEFYTRPSVEEDPEPYIEALLQADRLPDAALIEDPKVLARAGFWREGTYVSSMHATESSTNPEKKREELSEEGKDVLFFATGGKGNPFRTEYEVWTRREPVTARA